MRVLVIDDHPVVVQGYRQLLEGMDVREVLAAARLAEGFRLYRRRRPDIIITDLLINRHELAGLAFIRRVRLFDIRTPILVLTAGGDGGNGEEGGEDEVRVFLCPVGSRAEISVASEIHAPAL
jgi:two-component system invasion response regulator UvrY